VVTAVGYQWFCNGANVIPFKMGGEAIPPLNLATMRFAIAAALILPLALMAWTSLTQASESVMRLLVIA